MSHGTSCGKAKIVLAFHNRFLSHNASRAHVPLIVFTKVPVLEEGACKASKLPIAKINARVSQEDKEILLSSQV